ncbi:MAG: hypothetical protein ACT4OY_05050 [Alphaproteobacteria bacterium]
MMQKNKAQSGKNKPLPPLSANPDSAMQEMMGIIDNLRGIYMKETDAMTGADTDLFMKLQDEKLQAARQYQKGIEFIMDNKSDMRTAHPNLKARLAAMQEEFAALSQKNMEAIKRMQRCSQRLSETVMTAARDEARKQRAFNYAENGVIATSDRKSVSMGSINETA